MSESLKQIFNQAIKKLNGIEEAEQKVYWFLSEILQQPYRYFEPDTFLTDQQIKQFNHWIEAVANGEPIQYLIGRWDFYGYTFSLTPDVLIPRAETEELVERVLFTFHHRKIDQRFTIVDLGTGSGAIIITLYLELKKTLPITTLKKIRFIGSDISKHALTVARSNGMRYNAQIDWIHSDLLHEIPDQIDLLVSNPPYISKSDYQMLPSDVKKEPKIALTDGDDGTTFYQKVSLFKDLAKRDRILWLRN